MFKDYSSFEKKTDALRLSNDALSALKEVARQTRHYKTPAGVVIFGTDGYFDRVVDPKVGLTLSSDISVIAEHASGSNCALFAHGHLKGIIIDGQDVYFDHRLLSSVDILNLINCQAQVGNDVKIYTSCVSCDDIGNVTMQVLSCDGRYCYQSTNLQTESGNKLPNDHFEDLIQIEKAKF